MSGKPSVNTIVTPLSNTTGMEKSKGFPSYRVNIVVPKSKNGALFEHNPTSSDPRVGKWLEPAQGGRRRTKRGGSKRRDSKRRGSKRRGSKRRGSKRRASKRSHRRRTHRR